MDFTVEPQWALMIQENPGLAQSLTPLHDDSEVMSVEALLDSGLSARVDKAIKAAHSLFPMDEDKHCAQLWFHSFVTSVIQPVVICMLERDEVPLLDRDVASTFIEQAPHGSGGGFWYGCHPRRFVEISTDATQELAHTWVGIFGALIEELVQRHGAGRAALWAVVVDAISMMSTSAGNHAFSPYEGIAVSERILAAMSAHMPGETRLPRPRYVDYNGYEFVPSDIDAALDGEESEVDVLVTTKRLTCCMIFHCSSCDVCVSCPKQKPEDKQRRVAEQLSLLF